MLKYFEEGLKKKIDEYKDNPYYEAINYSLSSGGKRIRPMLVLNLAKSLNKDYKRVLDLAIAIEFIHNYSLVHDDLPCMDNDMYRRGNLTTHAKFGEYVGVLVGDTLLTEAFYILANSKSLKNKVKIISILTKSIGINGMLLGQLLDMQNEGKAINLDLISLIHQKKTAELIKASIKCCLVEFDIDNKEYIKIANNLGLIYQIQDDFFDADNSLDKSNLVNMLGKEKAQLLIDEKKEEIKDILKNNEEFYNYLKLILERKY